MIKGNTKHIANAVMNNALCYAHRLLGGDADGRQFSGVQRMTAAYGDGQGKSDEGIERMGEEAEAEGCTKGAARRK